MDYFEKTYHPPGTPPGTLVAREGDTAGQVSLRLLDYSGSGFAEQNLLRPEECRRWLEQDSITWLHVQGTAPADTLRKFGDIFGIHPLAMEDVLNQGQRSKVEDYDGQLFIIMAMPVIDDARVYIDQVSIFVGHNYVISFHGGDYDPFEPLRVRLRRQNGHLRTQGVDYLLYSMLDLIIDHGFPVLEHFGERIEFIEERLLRPQVKQTTLGEIHHTRRELLLLRRNLWPQREVINTLLRDDFALIHERTRVYLRDCHDHTIQIMELIENYRDMATSMIDVYLSSASNRLNESMRILTLIATLFIPLTFVTGLYGMNFSNADSPWAMPELHWYYGYPLVWGLIIAIVTAMLFYFKHKHWL